MRSAHAMPFGAEVGEDTVRFRLWAPGASAVELCLEDEPAPIPMPIDGQGWAALVTDRARPGARYRYLIDGRLRVPDPASRFQPDDVHGPSEVVDPRAFQWTEDGWLGLAWEEMIFYELHVGAFTPEGTFRGAERRLNDLARLGITAIELMPIADFPGRWNWGYDGVLPFAPDSRYGRPDDLKAFVQACHARGLAVLLDVVYNHFGPEGNYLGLYAPEFFTTRHQTPWGDAINFDGPRSEVVRAFFRENARFWIEEYHVDGLRLDAVHAIHDDSPTHIVDEIARAVHAAAAPARAVHLVLENDRNEARYLRPDASGRRYFAAQWNDDLHHALHVLCTGERDGYYADYPDPIAALARCLTEGFAYQGEYSPYRGRPRGESTARVPLAAFVSFLQNHDQVGNRALGERLTALAPAAVVRAAGAVLLLAPSPPLLFMGEEWAAPEPFLFFCDFEPDLGDRIGEGRRREFARFARFSDPAIRARIPNPQDERTFRRSVLDWERRARPEHRLWCEWTRELLHLRRHEITPRLRGTGRVEAKARRLDETALTVEWRFPDGVALRLLVNAGPAPSGSAAPWAAPGRRLYQSSARAEGAPVGPWQVEWYLAESCA